MLKTNYLGFHLKGVNKVRDTWHSYYFSFAKSITGEGHTPEAAVADAQKKVKIYVNQTN